MSTLADAATAEKALHPSDYSPIRHTVLADRWSA